MATIEQWRLARQTLINITNLRVNIRNNAKMYKRISDDAGRVPDQIEVMKKDAATYGRNLKWQEDIKGDAPRQANLTAGLVALGIASKDVDDEVAMLRAAQLKQATDGAGVADKATLDALSDTVVAMVPPLDSVWPE